MNTRALVLVSIVAAASASLAQEAANKKPDKPATRQSGAEKPPELPRPGPEIAKLKFFDGSWTCEGATLDSPFGPAGKFKSTVKSQTDLGGFWQSGTIKATMAGTPGAMEGRFHMTYDPGPKQYVLLWVDSMGAYAQQTSKGWEGDKVVFMGDTAMGGKKIRARDTFEKTGEGSMKHASEMQMNGKWVRLSDETCRKSGR